MSQNMEYTLRDTVIPLMLAQDELELNGWDGLASRVANPSIRFAGHLVEISYMN